MSEKKSKAALKITLPVLIAVFSMFIVSHLVSVSGYVNYHTEAINENRDTVLKLTASSTAASVAITALPGDIATPIAEELAQLSKGFLVVLCALYLEKFIVAVSAAVVFQWLIPISCGLFIVSQLSKKEFFRTLAIKLSLFAAAFMLIVPISVKISNIIEDSYHESITQVIDSAENSADQIQESIDGDKTSEESGKGLGKIIQSLKKSGDLIARGTAQLIDYFEKLLSRFVESLAIMLVISCVIPLLVIVFLVLILKALFHFDTYANFKHMETRIREKRDSNEEDKE